MMGSAVCTNVFNNKHDIPHSKHPLLLYRLMNLPQGELDVVVNFAPLHI